MPNATTRTDRISAETDKSCSVPSRAACTAPPTGGLKHAQPAARAAAVSTRPAAGELLVMSIHSAAAGNAASAPRPAITSCTSPGRGSTVMRTSASAASAAAAAAGGQRAPPAQNGLFQLSTPIPGHDRISGAPQRSRLDVDRAAATTLIGARLWPADR